MPNDLLQPCRLFLLAGLLGLSLASGCADDDGPSSNKRVTTVVLIVEGDDQQVSLYTARDLDTDAPEIEPVALRPDRRYELRLSFLEEQGGDVTVLTTAVTDQPDDHLVCFETTGDLPLPIPLDEDTAGRPLGLVSELLTNGPGAGDLRVQLRFLPDKNAATPCTSGAVDVDLTFEVTVGN